MIYLIRLKIKKIYNIKLNERNEIKSIINDYWISNLITLINSFIFTKWKRLINENL